MITRPIYSASLLVILWLLLFEQPNQPDVQLGRLVPSQHVRHESRLDLHLYLHISQRV